MSRQEEVAKERRRRNDGTLDAANNSKLAIPDEVKARLKAEGLTPRWINDEGNRIHNLSVKDDYDKVDGVDPVPAGTDKFGKPILAHLYAKRTDYIAEDASKRDLARKEKEAGMMRGEVPGTQSPDNMYAARGNSLGRGSQTIE